MTPRELFAHRLAIALGWPSVEWGLKQMSAAEFRRWQVYYQHEPFGGSWRQTATLCAMIGNSTPGRKVALKVADFMPCRPPKPKQSDADIAAFFVGMFHPKGAEQKAVADKIVADLEKHR